MTDMCGCLCLVLDVFMTDMCGCLCLRCVDVYDWFLMADNMYMTDICGCLWLSCLATVWQGDGNIRYYEVSDSDSGLHFLNVYQSSSPQRGLGKTRSFV